MFYRSPIISYLKAGYLLHLMTIGELILIFLILTNPDFQKWMSQAPVYLKPKIIFWLFCFPVFPQLDARSRFQNYKQIKDQLYRYGFRKRILRTVIKSRCQRDAASVAAEELGMGKECRQYFRQYGYRWYHLLPDFFFRKPQFLFYWYFWKTTFFIPTYTPEYDFKRMVAEKCEEVNRLEYGEE